MHAGVLQVSWVDEAAPGSSGLIRQHGCSRVRWRFPHARPVRCALIRLSPLLLAAGSLQLTQLDADTGGLVPVPSFLEAVEETASSLAPTQSTLLTVQVCCPPAQSDLCLVACWVPDIKTPHNYRLICMSCSVGRAHPQRRSGS